MKTIASEIYTLDEVDNFMDLHGIAYMSDAMILLEEIRAETDRMILLLSKFSNDIDIDASNVKVQFYEHSLNLI